jgi:hypothetical protein
VGLDMYLRARQSVYGHRHDRPSQFPPLVELFEVDKHLDPEHEIAFVEFGVGYWRKAWHVHRWFVANVQSDVDDCRSYEVTRAHLEQLRDFCTFLINVWEEAGEDAATAAAFAGKGWFVFQEQDSLYFHELETTVTQIDRALAMPQEWRFVYQGSW